VGRHPTSKSSLTCEAPFNVQGNIVNIISVFVYPYSSRFASTILLFPSQILTSILTLLFSFTVLSVDALIRDLCFVVYGLRLCRYCLGDEGILGGSESWWGPVVCHLRCAVVVCVMSV
jgi:hypothetical protein